ncbi:unnamed protein product [Ambrosiozyma monospora]|uniref:Pro-apoptotic serine protease NMA111 n=1 Tax=Ambrosiozyma monospora TaxID=43982 RepID=A0A9W6TAC7_AMBMO|nr:unnamed protein product [Ambrosiozyma monospora]
MMREKFPHINGLLVSTITLPEGPADGLIKEGDCLISINGQYISTFITVDDIFDSNVGNEVTILIQREGKNITVKCTVQDLHSITPNRYLTVCGTKFNDLSYQLARIYAIPVKGVFVSCASGSFALSEDYTFWIIDAIDNIDTPDLDSFIETLKQIPDKKYTPVKYHHLSDLDTPLFHTMLIDRHWLKSFTIATRNDKSGLWDFKTIQDKPVEPEPLTPKTAKYDDFPSEKEQFKQLSRSFVLCECFTPIWLDSHPAGCRKVHGVVLNAEKGYVLVSRYCVTHDLADINLIFAQSIYVPAKVIFLHPTKGYAIVKYDPSLVLAPVQTPKFSKEYLKRGEKVTFVGYTSEFRPIVDETKVSDVVVFNAPSDNTPRYRATNVEAIDLDSTNATNCGSGILVDNDANVRGFWMYFEDEEDTDYTIGIDVNDIMWELEFLEKGTKPNVKIIDAVFNTLTIMSARVNGVPEEWLEIVEDKCVDKVQLLTVANISINLDNKPASALKHGDILLSANDVVITRFRDIDSVIRHLAPTEEYINMKVVRDKKILDLRVKLAEAKYMLTDKIVCWAGCTLQAPHHSVRQVIKNLPSRVYCLSIDQGSPSEMYSLGVTNFITRVNGVPTQTLDDFLEAVRDIKDNSYCKLRIVSMPEKIPFAQTLKVNYHYFPTTELLKNDVSEWVFKKILATDIEQL